MFHTFTVAEFKHEIGFGSNYQDQLVELAAIFKRNMNFSFPGGRPWSKEYTLKTAELVQDYFIYNPDTTPLGICYQHLFGSYRHQEKNAWQILVNDAAKIEEGQQPDQADKMEMLFELLSNMSLLNKNITRFKLNIPWQKNLLNSIEEAVTVRHQLTNNPTSVNCCNRLYNKCPKAYPFDEFLNQSLINIGEPVSQRSDYIANLIMVILSVTKNKDWANWFLAKKVDKQKMIFKLRVLSRNASLGVRFAQDVNSGIMESCLSAIHEMFMLINGMITTAGSLIPFRTFTVNDYKYLLPAAAETFYLGWNCSTLGYTVMTAYLWALYIGKHKIAQIVEMSYRKTRLIGTMVLNGLYLKGASENIAQQLVYISNKNKKLLITVAMSNPIMENGKVFRENFPWLKHGTNETNETKTNETNESFLSNAIDAELASTTCLTLAFVMFAPYQQFWNSSLTAAVFAAKNYLAQIQCVKLLKLRNLQEHPLLTLLDTPPPVQERSIRSIRSKSTGRQTAKKTAKKTAQTPAKTTARSTSKGRGVQRRGAKKK